MSKETLKLPLISIAVCTYNGENHLVEQLDSLINQTYKNLEIVIVDDCSTDNTYQIVESYQRKYSNILCFKNAENIGYNKNFEKALLLCSGDFIAISDQDDIWQLNKIEELHKHIGENWLVYSNSALIDEHGNHTGEVLVKREQQKQDFKSIILSNYITGHTMLLSKSFVDIAIPLPQVGFYDWYLGFVAVYEKKAVFLNKNLTNYRIHPESVIRQMDKQSKKKYEKKMLQIVIDQFNAYLKYPFLSRKDFDYINHIKTGIILKERKRFSFSLFKIISKDYSSLFPNLKKRNFFSRINFARRYSQGL